MQIQHHLVTAIFKRENSVLLMFRQGTGTADNFWSLPMGHVDNDETDEEALIREMEEELGVEPRQFSRLRKIQDEVASVSNQIFEVTHWSGEPVNRETNKCTAIAWFELTHLPTPLNPVALMILTECGFKSRK